LAKNSPKLTEFYACPRCDELLAEVEAATERHIAAVSRYQRAAIVRTLQLLPELEAGMEKAARTRQQAVEAYNEHLLSHQAARAGSGGY
jgi:hypothetical protein